MTNEEETIFHERLVCYAVNARYNSFNALLFPVDSCFVSQEAIEGNRSHLFQTIKLRSIRRLSRGPDPVGRRATMR